MPLNLIKLCVGVESVAHLHDLQQDRLKRRAADGLPVELIHITRMMPRRREELLAGGSLYWVIKGVIQVRQEFIDIRAETDAEGRARCALVYYPEHILTRPQPRRPFQGWRYLEAQDAPKDLPLTTDGIEALPAKMRAELMELGLL